MLAVPPCRLLVARHVAGLRRILDSPFDTKDGKISRPISNLHHPDHEAERAARFPGRRRTRRRAGGGPPPGAGAAGDFRSIAELERNWARRCSSATPGRSSRRSDRPSCAAPPPSTMRSSAPATRRANCAAPSTAASRWACPPPRTWSCSPTCCLRSARAFPTSTWKSSTASIRWSRRAAGRFHGFLRRPGAARACRASCGSRSCSTIPASSWAAGAIRWRRRNRCANWQTPTGSPRPSPTRPREELGPLFEKHGLPAPKLAMRAQSALTFLTALPSSDLLMMLPVQWLRYPLLRDTFQEIKVREAARAARLHRAAHRTAADAGGRTLLHAAARRRAHQEAVAPAGARNRRQEVQAARVQRDGSDPAGSTAWPS